MNDSNAGMAPDRIGVLSEDIKCTASCETCLYNQIRTLPSNRFATHTQDIFDIPHCCPFLRCNAVFCQLRLIWESEEIIDSLLDQFQHILNSINIRPYQA